MKTKQAKNAVEWVRDEVGAMCYSQTGDCINVPELSLTRLVQTRNSLLERLKEAERLLREACTCMPSEWFDRRDALLNPTNKDVM